MHCSIHLVKAKSGEAIDALLDKTSGSPSYLIKARAYGWVHLPHQPAHKELLLAHQWDLFFLTQQSDLPNILEEHIAAHVSLNIRISLEQLQQLKSQTETVPQPNANTPPLPSEWPKDGGVPSSAISSTSDAPLKPGELHLEKSMADFLSTSLPAEVRNAPVGLMNMFRYPGGDRSVHEHYMEGFKRDFGDAAGVSMKFMGPVTSPISSSGGAENAATSTQTWNDANLVQYDTIWHYAYMLSTDVYAELNKEKIEGLEDTCILLTSDVMLSGNPSTS